MWWNEEQDILEIIHGAKERLLDAAAFEAAIIPGDDVLVEAVRYFQVYEQALSAAGAIDFTDMVPLVVKAMTRNASYRRFRRSGRQYQPAARGDVPQVGDKHRATCLQR
jgi:hypothetical protein